MLCVRFKSNFIKNARSTAYSVLRQPLFKGNFVNFKKSDFDVYRSVDFQFMKCDQDFHGQFIISYQNGCFNSLGFLTHDIAV